MDLWHPPCSVSRAPTEVARVAFLRAFCLQQGGLLAHFGNKQAPSWTPPLSPCPQQKPLCCLCHRVKTLTELISTEAAGEVWPGTGCGVAGSMSGFDGLASHVITCT